MSTWTNYHLQLTSRTNMTSRTLYRDFLTTQAIVTLQQDLHRVQRQTLTPSDKTAKFDRAPREISVSYETNVIRKSMPNSNYTE